MCYGILISILHLDMEIYQTPIIESTKKRHFQPISVGQKKHRRSEMDQAGDITEKVDGYTMMNTEY